MKKNPYLKNELKYFLHTFNRQPLLITRAKGSRVWDEKGKSYIDFYSGLAVCGVGHNNKNIVSAIKKQTDQLLHSSNFFYTQPQNKCAKALTSRFKNSRAFFSNSGAEANEMAVKLARLWATRTKRSGREIITFKDSFHGRTLAMTSATNGGSASDAFKPLPAGFKMVPFNHLDAVKKAINKKTIAVMIEPIQGEGGINIADQTFMKGVAALCRKKNILLILDEIQTGMGRSGSFFAYEQYGIKPDMVTLAKGLAGGLPLGATLAQPNIAKWMVPGLHGSTFGGNPVACAAALEVLKLLSDKALKTIRTSGHTIRKRLSSFSPYKSVRSIRGKGLMLAIELNTNGGPYVTLARKKGLLINCTQGCVLRFLPPYFMTKNEIDKSLSILHSVFKTLN